MVNQSLRATLLIAMSLCLPACHAAVRTPSTGAADGAGVGLRVFWASDHARRFANDAYGRDVRRMGVVVWYPAVPDPARPTDSLTLGGVIAKLEDTAPQAAKSLASRSRSYTLESIRTYAVEPHTNADERAATQLESALLASPTRGIANARPAPGRHPVVIYHPGLGGNPLENAGLCENLAARGHVVITSTFLHQEDWQDSFYCGQADTSLADIAFLLNHVDACLPFADTERVALVGHSFGAQVALIAACQPGNTIDAVVALDTTIDYKSVEDIESPLYRSTSWNRVLQAVTENAHHCRAAVLNVSGTMPDGATPGYAAVRRLIDSRIVLATIGYDMDHDAYLTQTLLAGSFQGTADVPAPSVGRERDRKSFAAVARLAADFLDHELGGAAPASPRSDAEITVTHHNPVHRPTAAEALTIYKAEGLQAVKARYRTLQSISPRAKFSTTAILDDMLSHGAHSEAIDLLEFLLAFESNTDNWRLNQRLGDVFRSTGNTMQAEAHYRQALAHCDDARAASQIKKLVD